jgi:hypothetical protein
VALTVGEFRPQPEVDIGELRGQRTHIGSVELDESSAGVIVQMQPKIEAASS